MIRILLVDDQTLIRQGIQTLLDLEPDLEVVGQAGDGEAALALAEKLRPDVALMDVRMPHMDGVTATRLLGERLPGLPVIILTTFDDDEHIFEGLKAGARGYLLKDISSDEMAHAIRTVAAGNALIQPSITQKVIAEFTRLSSQDRAAPESDAAAPPPATPSGPALTERELEVLRAMASGLSNRDIAESLSISEGTVKNHVSNVLGKLEARSRAQAILKAQALRLT